MGNWFSKDVDLAVAAQLKHHFSKEKKKTHPFVTITRMYGCDGKKVATLVAEKLSEGDGPQWEVVSREMLLEATTEGKLSDETMAQLERYGHSELESYLRDAIFGMGNMVEVTQQVSKIMHLMAAKGHVVFLGGGASIITGDMEKGVHVQLYAPEEWRIANHAKRWSLDEAEALKRVKGHHNYREAFVKTFLGESLFDSRHYDLMIDNARVTSRESANLIATLVRDRY